MTDKPIRVIVLRPERRKFFIARWTDPETGRQRSQSTGHVNKRDAERWAGKLEKRLNAGEDVTTRRTTWAEFRKRVESSMFADLSKGTQGSYRETLNAIEEHVNPRLVTAIHTEAVDKFVAGLRSTGMREPTVARHLRSLKAMLRWANRRKMLPTVPTFDMPKRTKVAGGRPLTDREFVRMLGACKSVVGRDRAESWKHLLCGLWASGLRISEAAMLTWDGDGMPRVDLKRKRPMLFIPGPFQKSRRDTVTPIVPEFLELLQTTPESDRKGFVFHPAPASDGSPRLKLDAVKAIVRKIGRRSGVRTRSDRESFASAHDLRRSFCHRWSRKVLPQVLRILARHADIQTTLVFYADADAEMSFDAAWEAIAAGSGVKSGDTKPRTPRKRTRKTTQPPA